MGHNKYVYLIVVVLFIVLSGGEKKYTESDQATEYPVSGGNSQIVVENHPEELLEFRAVLQ